MTIILFLKSEAIRKELNMQKSDYISEQRNIRVKLKSLRSSVWKDDLITLSVKSQIRTELYGYQQKFNRLLTFKDRYLVNKTIKMFDPKNNSFDKEILCKNIDYLIARFEKKEATK